MTGNRRAAVLGHPIGHSLSPVLHRAAYRALGLDWTYEAIDVDRHELAGFVAGMDDSWAGLSLTAPLKQAIMPLLAATSAMADQVGAVNTVVVQPGETPRLIGHNTDVLGIVHALSEVTAGVAAARSDPRRALGSQRGLGIVGAGGTAAAALVAARVMAADRVVVAARRAEAARSLIDQVCGGWPTPPEVATWGDLYEALAQPVVICTLPGDAAASLAEQVPNDPGTLLDVTYHPWPTTLAAAWSDRGGTVIAGHRMLLWQAVAQVELMTGVQAPDEAMSEALSLALAPSD